MVTLLVDNIKLAVEEGTNLLKACLDNNIYIPNLCYVEGMTPPAASCRLCFVEIKGEEHPVTACTVKVNREMVVTTDTPRVRQLQKTALQLLLSVHHVDCRNCPANKKCALQDMARFCARFTKPDNRIAQFGDNDSGRFFKFLPMMGSMRVKEAKQLYTNLYRYRDLPDEAEAFAQADWELHHQLTVCSGNPVFTLILNGFQDLYPTMGRLYFSNPAGRAASRQFYQGLIESIQAGDPEMAYTVTREAMLTSSALWGSTGKGGADGKV